MERLFVDTSAWFAYVNRAAHGHRVVRGLLHSFRERLVTTNFVFYEMVTLCAYRLGHRIAARVGATLLDPDVMDLVRATVDDEKATWELFLARPDKGYSFTDCTSFVIMRRLAIERALALDDDFQREGFVVVPERHKRR